MTPAANCLHHHQDVKQPLKLFPFHSPLTASAKLAAVFPSHISAATSSRSCAWFCCLQCHYGSWRNPWPWWGMYRESTGIALVQDTGYGDLEQNGKKPWRRAATKDHQQSVKRLRSPPWSWNLLNLEWWMQLVQTMKRLHPWLHHTTHPMPITTPAYPSISFPLHTPIHIMHRFPISLYYSLPQISCVHQTHFSLYFIPPPFLFLYLIPIFFFYILS